MTKRFFDKEDIEYFFKDFEIQYINEENMNRWNKDKIVWKCFLKSK